MLPFERSCVVKFWKFKKILKALHPISSIYSRNFPFRNFVCFRVALTVFEISSIWNFNNLRIVYEYILDMFWRQIPSAMTVDQHLDYSSSF